MLKLIIADDERVIRETISTIIDWKKYDIELVGLCKNGLEAYDMILDESPDIVLTDICMPGMDAMELLKKVSVMDSPPQFILLSGYSEFEYARKAMKYGVKHYLLKPCRESQILESIQSVAKDCYKKYAIQYQREDQFYAANNMAHNVMFNIINDSIYRSQNYEDTFRSFEPFLDFHFTQYKLAYIYYLEEQNLEHVLSLLKKYCIQHMPYLTIHGIYIRNTLLLFFKDFSDNYEDFLAFLSTMELPGQKVQQEITLETYLNLTQLLPMILDKIRRYSIIYYIHSFHVISCCNYGFVAKELEQLFSAILEGDSQASNRLLSIFDDTQDISFLKQLSGSLLLRLSLEHTGISSIQLTEFLTSMSQESSVTNLGLQLNHFLEEIKEDQKTSESTDPMVQQICQYVDHHISDDNLTLKAIAEQYLFMNTDYVSRKFQKETGQKFSSYLTSVRIKKAKEYLSANTPEKIQNVATMVGCGNNPQYFSQLFRKHTGMTPSAYVAKIHGLEEE